MSVVVEDRLMLSDRELGYLEGIIDGEGSIMICKQKRKGRDGTYFPGYSYSSRVDIANTNLELLQYIQELLGSGNICLSSPNTEKHKAIYRYMMPRAIQRLLLPKLKLVIKERQRLLLLYSLDIFKQRKGSHDHSESSEELEELYKEMKNLNKKGKEAGI